MSRAFDGGIMGMIFFRKEAYILVSNVLPKSINRILTCGNTISDIRCIANGLIVVKVHHSSGVS